MQPITLKLVFLVHEIYFLYVFFFYGAQFAECEGPVVEGPFEGFPDTNRF